MRRDKRDGEQTKCNRIEKILFAGTSLVSPPLSPVINIMNIGLKKEASYTADHPRVK
jgi:hypothetical protein